MDWERAKTVLILAFLVLNAIFIFQLWLEPMYIDSSMRIEPSQVEDKLAELQYKNITVTAEVPRRLQIMQTLSVRCPEPDYFNDAKAVLGNGAIWVSPANKAIGYRKYISDAGEAMVYTDGRITFRSASASTKGAISQDNARETAEKFLRNTLGKPRDARLGRVGQAEDGTWIVEYYQRWRRKDLEISRIILRVDENGVLDMDYFWVEIVGFTGADVPTIPATGALTVAAERMPSGSVITEIYSSWYSPPVPTEQWRSYPAWVLLTSTGTKYFINAFTGDFEGSEEFPAGKPGSALK